jgi:hypothetical protein
VAALTKDEWKARLTPHLSSSLETVSDVIMQATPVQNWLRSASTAAAEGLGQSQDMKSEMAGYVRMKNELEEALPQLVAAVDELTNGCGHLDVEWRPLQPTQSRVYVAFDRNFTVSLFYPLSECTGEATREALSTVADALPQGDPFPNRPNEVTGLVASEQEAVGVRMKEHLTQDRGGRYRIVTLLPPDRSALENLDVSEATRRLLHLLCADPTE